MLRVWATFFVFLVLSGAASADTPLGITGAEFRLGFAGPDRGAAMASLGPIKNSGDDLDVALGFAAVNVALTPYHGAQGDAVFAQTPDGAIGRLGGHLFMTPTEGHKYGLFVSLADVDGEAVTYGTFGAEGILALSPQTSVELRGGIGAASVDGLDYLFAGARIVHAFDEVTVYAGYDLAEFDELSFSAIGHDMVAGVEINAVGSGLKIFTEIARARLTGTDAAPDETNFRAGITIRFGRIGGATPLTRPFHTGDPVAQLVRRGFF
jgi:hypothetical protein